MGVIYTHPLCLPCYKLFYILEIATATDKSKHNKNDGQFVELNWNSKLLKNLD